MMQKFNKLCEDILTEARRKPIKRKTAHVRNVPVKKNIDQYCKGKTKEMDTPLTQTKNVR